jgi:hypothetical protein
MDPGAAIWKSMGRPSVSERQQQQRGIVFVPLFSGGRRSRGTAGWEWAVARDARRHRTYRIRNNKLARGCNRFATARDDIGEGGFCAELKRCANISITVRMHYLYSLDAKC